jgi:hypothetical protein
MLDGSAINDFMEIHATDQEEAKEYIGSLVENGKLIGAIRFADVSSLDLELIQHKGYLPQTNEEQAEILSCQCRECFGKEDIANEKPDIREYIIELEEQLIQHQEALEAMAKELKNAKRGQKEGKKEVKGDTKKKRIKPTN